MARFERLEPRTDDLPVFDGGIDDEDEEEGSRLPLLIFIAVLVLFLFAGVVYYAYTEGVERGRADAPRVIVAQSTGTKLKVYQQPAPAEDESSEADSVPAPPTPMAATPSANTPPSSSAGATAEAQPQGSANTSPEAADNSPPPASPPPSAKPTPKPVERVAVSTPPPKTVASVSTSSPPRIATHAPAPLVIPAEPSTATPPPPVAATTAPASAEPAPTPVTGGSTLLQIGAYKSQDEADTAWRAFQKKHPVVGGFQSDVKQVDLGEKGTWYRLRIGPFESKDAATEVCTKLKADGASCLIAR
jgi:cell division protein FtsN